VYLLVVIQRRPSLAVSICVEVEDTYYCGEYTARRVRGGYLAYSPALLSGCTPLRYVYKARCDLDHLLGEALQTPVLRAIPSALGAPLCATFQLLRWS